jgi:hypothetical protein
MLNQLQFCLQAGAVLYLFSFEAIPRTLRSGIVNLFTFVYTLSTDLLGLARHLDLNLPAMSSVASSIGAGLTYLLDFHQCFQQPTASAPTTDAIISVIWVKEEEGKRRCQGTTARGQCKRLESTAGTVINGLYYCCELHLSQGRSRGDF